jgi:hypothetical protein
MKKNHLSTIVPLIVGGFLATATLGFCLILPGECRAGGFNGQAAYNYAATYWDEVVSDGYYWIEDANVNQYCPYFGSGTSVSVVQNYINTYYPGGAGVDCAHFVSCCIGLGGGLSVPPQAQGQSYYGYAYAPYLVSWLTSSGNGVVESSVSALQVGDVIGYDWDANNSIDHVALYIGNGQIAAHSSCYWGTNWNFYAASHPNVKYTFIHILTSALSPNMSLAYNGTAIPNGDSSPTAAKGTDFGTIVYGFQSSPRTFTINNSGTGALNLTGVPRVQFGGNNPSDFYMTAQPATPVGANGGSTTFQLVFEPTVNTGLRSATVTIANNDPNKNPYTFTVQGTAQIQQRIDPSLEYNGPTISNGDQSPTVTKGTDFGSVNVGSQSSTHSFQFYNYGNINMTLTGSIVQLSGANSGDFAIVSIPSSPIAPNQYSTIGIRFQPTGSGLRTASILIYFDATYGLGATSPYTVALQGAGLADTTPPALTIGSPLNNAVVTSASLPVSGTASDSGLGNNGVSSVTVNGASASGGTASGTGTANWSATVTLNAGANTVTVVAKDTLNNSTQKVVSATYNPPRPTFGGSSVTGGKLQTTLTGLSVGENIVFYVSSDLKIWTPLQTNSVLTGSTLTFTNTINPAMKNQFFRAVVQ